MEKVNYEEVEKIFEDGSVDWNGDNVFQGLMIIAKYIDPKNKDIIKGADHDVIYSEDVQILIDLGMKKEEFKSLAELNWSIEDGYLQCFV